MAYAGSISHRPDFQDYYPLGWQGASENVASRQYESEPDIGDKLYEQWQNSPGHYANMVDPDTNTIGIGLTYDAYNDKWYGTQNFAAYPDTSRLTVTGTSTASPEYVQPAPAPADDARPAAPAAEPPAASSGVYPEVTVQEAQAVDAPRAVEVPQVAKKDEPKAEAITIVPGPSAPIREISEPESPRQLDPETMKELPLPETGMKSWIPGSAVISFLMGSLFLVVKRKYALG